MITIEKTQPLTEAVAIHDNLIQAVGANEEILALKGPDAVVIDLRGKTLMPGFVEGHIHYIRNGWGDGIPLEEMMSNLVRFGLTNETEMHSTREFIDAMLAAEQNNKVVVRMNILRNTTMVFWKTTRQLLIQSGIWIIPPSLIRPVWCESRA